MSPPKDQRSEPTVWVLTDGKIGMRAQALGLAERLELPFSEKTLVTKQPWRTLPPAFWPSGVFGLSNSEGDSLTPPWPDMTISCGRQAIGPALAIKHASKGATKAVHIQHPRVRPSLFDLIIAPEHDDLTGPNVLTITGSMHRVTANQLHTARSQFHHQFSHLTHPLIAVLIGGNNKAYDLTPNHTRDLAQAIKTAAEAIGAGVLVTTSRRTGEENERILRQILSGSNTVFWDGKEPNPYFGYLALADIILVTGDSVNMVSEACSVGKPVYLLKLPIVKNGERAAKKFELFHNAMQKHDALRQFDGVIDPTWDATKFDEASKVAAQVKTLLLP